MPPVVVTSADAEKDRLTVQTMRFIARARGEERVGRHRRYHCQSAGPIVHRSGMDRLPPQRTKRRCAENGR